MSLDLDTPLLHRWGCTHTDPTSPDVRVMVCQLCAEAVIEKLAGELAGSRTLCGIYRECVRITSPRMLEAIDEFVCKDDESP